MTDPILSGPIPSGLVRIHPGTLPGRREPRGARHPDRRLAQHRRAAADSCSSSTEDALSHRRTIGRDYNAPAHATGDGTAVPADTSCQLYFNYFHGTDFTGNGGHWADPAAGTTSGTVMYRFTTNDGAAVVVRDPALGWGFLPIGCVTRPATLYDDND